jgi:hypothetical protein
MPDHAEQFQRTKETAERVILRILAKLQQEPPKGSKYLDHLAKALDAVSSGACVIGGACHDGYSAADCSPVGSYSGDGSHCA